MVIRLHLRAGLETLVSLDVVKENPHERCFRYGDLGRGGVAQPCLLAPVLPSPRKGYAVTPPAMFSET